MTNREILEYALKAQRVHEVLVLKDDIHLQYKYKNINRAASQASTFQDKIIDAVIEDAVTGTSDPISSATIKNNVENIIDTNLRNDTKRLSHGIPKKAVEAAVSNISNRYQFILGNRIREEIPNLQGKIEDYINTKNLSNLSEAELTEKLKSEYGEHAQKRIKNIIRDSFHTNECNLSWIKAIYDGYSYKSWHNGRTKRTRVWHKAKFIESVPIDETFDIYGSYPARMMYPGDLNGGAENVANCRCWLSYSNRPPSDLRGTGKKTTTKSRKSDKSKNNNGISSKVKNTIKNALTKISSKISNMDNTINIKNTESFKRFYLKDNKNAEKILVLPDNTPTKTKRNIPKGKDFKKLILYHLLKTRNQSKEYLTIVSNTGVIVVDLLPGTESGVDIPSKLKQEGLKNGFYLSIHNHYYGAIMPSYEDMFSYLLYDVKEAIITSQFRIGTVKFNSDLSLQQKKGVLAIYSTFEWKMFDDFEEDYGSDVESLSRGEYDDEFEKFISKYSDDYVKEFNNRLKDYNVELTYNNISSRR